jgi:predicted hydrocarbon binding protein
MPDTVHVLLPLSLLEAIRSVDTPEGYDVEYVHELRNKRLGLSDTVYAQILRYGDAMKRNQPIPAVEATSLARLIGRRADAEDVFRKAGRIVAARMYEKIPRVTRRLTHILSGFLARPIAFRRMRSAFAKYLGGTVHRSGGNLLLEVRDSVTAEGANGSEGCAYYEAALGEMLKLVLGGDPQVEHTRCNKKDASGRGKGCEWRVEWRGRHKPEPKAHA